MTKDGATFLSLWFFAVGAAAVQAAEPTTVQEQVVQVLSLRYPSSQIELTSGVRCQDGQAYGTSEPVRHVTVEQESASGQVQLGLDGRTDCWVSFAAWAPAWIANKRIQPGERLKKDLFSLQRVNVAAGMAREFRGAILGEKSDLDTLQAKQTILEGGFALSNGVQKIPDIKRGDVIRLHLISGDVTLTTAGVAEEPGYTNDMIHVMSAKTKHGLIGKLLADGVVEVKL